MHRRYIIKALMLILSLVVYSSFHQIDEYVYRHTTAGEIEESIWRVEQNSHGAVLTCVYDDGTQVYQLDETLNTVAWHREDSDSSTELSGNVTTEGKLIIEGTFKGENLVKCIDLDGLPWMQKYPYSLKSFVQSKEKACEFWALKFDDLKPYKLCAKKVCEETVVSPDGDFMACKIRVSAAGWRSKFYSVNYWYRHEDGMFVRFEGVNGPPGSPKTEIVMQQETAIR